MRFIQIYIPVALIATALFASCERETPPLPDNLVDFEAAQLGFEPTEDQKIVALQFSRNTDVETRIIIEVETSGLENGTMFTTMPETVNGTITLPVMAGASKATIVINKQQGIFLSGTEFIRFKINDAGNSLVKGARCNIKLVFAPIVSTGSSMTLQGGPGETNAIHSVFVNFRGNVQTQARRDSWDLAFYSGNEFRVVLNNTTGAAATGINKFNLREVTSADTLNLDLTITTSNTNAINIVDDMDGNLDRTVIGNISANPAENRVFILNRGTSGGIAPRGWKKIRVSRGENGYILEHANINDTNFQTINIPKNDEFNFVYFSFDNGVVQVEPRKLSWDIKWTGGLNPTMFNNNAVPFYFADLVLTNDKGGVTVAQVLTSSITWEAFDQTHLPSLSFSANRNTIGSGWRVTRGAIGVARDRFYVVKDGHGNYYKLRFLNFHSNDGGTRGFPNIEYVLVKQGGS